MIHNIGKYHIRKTPDLDEVYFIYLLLSFHIPIYISAHTFWSNATPFHNNFGCFTACVMQLRWKSYPILLLTDFMSLLLNKKILDMQEHITIFHPAAVQLPCIITHFNLLNNSWIDKSDFFRGILVFRHNPWYHLNPQYTSMRI